MAVKNTERRIQILSYAYELISSDQYEDASMAQIAKGVGISKSLLQRYYPQKKLLLENMLDDILNVSFAYMDQLPWEYDDIFQKISDFDRLFFWMTGKNYRFSRFILASVGQADFLDIWIEIICNWLKKLCGEETFSYLKLRRALCIAMGGAMHLYQHMDELGSDYRDVAKVDTRFTLDMLGFDNEYISALLTTTEDRTKEMDPVKCLLYCAEHIPWFTV